MSRVKRGTVTKKRHKRLLKAASGYWGQRNNIFKRAKETVMRAMAYAFEGRKHCKRDMRSLFITRINAAAEKHDLSYSNFMQGLKKADIQLNRKMLSQLAIFDANVFASLATIAKG
jgi:large subunit ribosomal protein L20